jgi:hypothetical protein
MRRLLLSSLLLVTLLASISAASAASWQKPYFAATHPGSWARYSDVSPGMQMTTTMTRLADDGDKARIDVEVAFANDQYPKVRNHYTLKSGFPLAAQLIDYMGSISSGSISSGDTEPTVLNAAALAGMARSAPRYGPSATFRKRETVAGHLADRYSYTISNAAASTTESGDLWLSDAVPFGVVKQSSATKDAHGKVVATYERTLIASGTKTGGESSTAVAKNTAAATRKPMTINEAYAAGLVQVTITIAASSHNGERAHLIIEKKADAKLSTLVLPKGTTTLHVDSPIEDFVFEMATAKTFDMSGGKAAEADVKQLGQQRAMDGRFTISMYEGTPIFSGALTVGYVK